MGSLGVVLVSVLFTGVRLPAAIPAPVPGRVSVSSGGVQGNGDSVAPAISADGRFVAFESRATNLVPADTNRKSDVFVHDRQTGETTRVSIGVAGQEGNGDSVAPAISGDGCHVAFESRATNLVPGDTNQKIDVFVHDCGTGETSRVSVTSSGQEGNGDSTHAAISADGRFVAFESKATNLVPGDTNRKTDVFVHDRELHQTFRASVASSGQEGNGDSGRPAISGDGSLVAFESKATNLVAGDTNRKTDVFVHDRSTGHTSRVSVTSVGLEGNGDSTLAAISADGNVAAFVSKATNLAAGDSNRVSDLFVHERQTGVTTRITRFDGAQANQQSEEPSLSGDGRFVVFASSATNLVGDDTNRKKDVFVHDRWTGTTTRLGGPGGTAGDQHSGEPVISADGGAIAFSSRATNLAAGDSNRKTDVFVYQRNHAPVAGDDVASTTTDTAVLVPVLDNDSDGDGDVLTIVSVTQGTRGTVAVVGSTIQYTPDGGLAGSDSFTYAIDDGRGGTATATVRVTLLNVPPVNQPPGLSAGGDPVITLPAVANLSGTVTDDGLPSPPGAVTVTWSKVSGPGDVTFGDAHSATTTASFSAAGDYVLRLTADDGALSTPVDVSVTVNPAGPTLPPDPAAVASSIDQRVATTVGASTEFLYSGTNPIQTGVAPGTIEVTRAAVIRGRVIDRDGAPLPGARITILRHAEFGETMSRADGMFDMAVNGGGLLIVNYEKVGFLPAQRQASVPWQDWVVMPDVALVPLDSQVTTIDLTSSAPIQVARGSIVTDTDGSRQATLLFPQGLQAQMVMPDGTSQPLTALSVRATEYTVGARGFDAMPAELPSTTGYTYAAELSVDEALAAGAGSVTFNQPVPMYVENFLGFPVGGIVPLGYYDRGRGKWVPSDNGRVISVLGVSAGLATLDVDGTGSSASATRLAELGITDAERQQVATLYAAGTSLWRAPIPHFTSWDANWGVGPTPGAEAPMTDPPITDASLDDGSCRSGSVIACQDQALGESLQLTGVPYTLNYKSDRVPGRRAADTLEIPLIGPNIPPGLLRITRIIQLQGHYLVNDYCPTPNLTSTFTWNRRDVYGRLVQGPQPVNIAIGYVYRSVYQRPADLRRAFGYYGNGSFQVLTQENNGGEVCPGVPFTVTTVAGVPARLPAFVFWQFRTARIGAWDARGQGLGGWTLAPHHAYDPVGRALYLGSGERRSMEGGQGLGAITTVAGTGTAGSSGDGGPATQAQLRFPRSVAVDASGRLHITDEFNACVRRVDRDGIITVVAGVCQSQGSTGDGGPAVQAGLRDPQGIAFGPDGSLYIADRGNNKVRKVDPDGIISTVAGTGGCCSAGDGGLATAATLFNPTGVAVTPDGSLYIADSSSLVVRRVSPDGIITKFAGNGQCCFAGDGGPATQAKLFSPTGVAVAPDGTVYIADSLGHRVRKVSRDGVITTVAGTGSASFGGDGNPASGAALNGPTDVAPGSDGSLFIADHNNHRIRVVTPEGIMLTFAGTGVAGSGGDLGPAPLGRLTAPTGVAVSPSSQLYVADQGNHRVRAIGPALPGFGVTDIVIPSQAGDSLAIFTGSGLHLRTLDALTGAVRHAISYDADGRLATVTDGDGNVTTIERDGQGDPVAIVGPFGQRTALTLDTNGYLASVTDPAGETTRLTSQSDGLLSALTTPRGHVYQFTYDALGRLTRDADPAGGSQSLARVEQSSGHTVSLATALGRTTTYLVEKLSSGARRRLDTHPDGIADELVERPDGTSTERLRDGTTRTLTLAPDPRWGMLAAIQGSQTITTPGGLSSTVTFGRTATLSDPSNPLSLVTQTDTLKINARTYTTAYTAATRTSVTTSPAGRQVTTTTDAQGRITQTQVSGLAPLSFTYDARGHLIAATSTSGVETRSISLSYGTDGRLTTATDTLGRATQFEYDALGRIVRNVLTDGRFVDLTYDAGGNVSTVTPPDRPAHRFGYTPLDREASYAQPDVGSGVDETALAYDTDRAIASVTRPDGQTVIYAYDTAGRLGTLTTPDGLLDYGYSPTSGMVTSVTAPGGVGLAHAYDGSLLTGSTWSGPVAGSVGRTYDSEFRLSSLSVNGAQPIGLQYEIDGLLTAVGGLAVVRHAQHGLVTGTSLGTVTDAWQYNGFGEPTRYAASVGGVEVFSVVYARDAVGRIASKVEVRGGVTHAFSYVYDAAARLVDVARDGTSIESYSYDANGNRLTAALSTGTVAGTYDARDRLTRYGAAEYAYTTSGELASKTIGTTITTYQYDVLGNLRTVTLPDGTRIGYLIDGLNRRVGKQVNGTLVQGFLYHDQLRPIAELDGAGNVVSRFVYTTRDNVPAFLIKGSSTYRVVTDHLGSPRLVINIADGTVAQELEYDSFGNVTMNTNPGFQPFGFAGGIHDEAVGLVRLGARDYDPTVGRWTTRDKIGFVGGSTNLYAYVDSDPVNFVDPYGLSVLSAVGNFLLGAVQAVVGGVVTAAAVGTGTVIGGIVAAGLITYGAVSVGVGLAEVVSGQTVGGQRLSDEDRVDRAAGLLGGFAGGMFGAGSYPKGSEFEIPLGLCRGPNGKPARVAPWGNRTGNQYGELPHYHRAISDPQNPGQSLPFQGIRNHRPWEGGF